jgi:hypothetical protein
MAICVCGLYVGLDMDDVTPQALKCMDRRDR